jgi:hypothetical protein
MKQNVVTRMFAASCIALMLLAGFVSAAGPAIEMPLVGLVYTEAKFAPLVFRNANQGGRVLVDDPYGIFRENGNINERQNNYAFTGEQVKWKVLVWDKNGVPDKIADVFSGWSDRTNGPSDPELQSNCYMLPKVENGRLLSEMGYNNVVAPNEELPETHFNTGTMSEYECILTVEPTCYGQKWFGVKVVDFDGLTGTMNEAEAWFCNPAVSLTMSGSLDFGNMGPGQQRAQTFSVTNAAEGGVQVIMKMGGTDFYDPSSSGAKCPTSNVLKLQGVSTDTNPATYNTGFWYTATQGSATKGPTRISYANNIILAEPIFGYGVPTSPGSSASVTLHLGLPMPCNGQFTDGRISLWAYAI